MRAKVVTYFVLANVIVWSSFSLRGADASKLLKESRTVGAVEITAICKETLVSGAENVVEITVRNVGEGDIVYTPQPPLMGITLAVKCAGASVKPSSLYSSWTRPSFLTIVPTRLQKAQEVHVILNVTRLFDLSVPDKYEIIASWEGISPSDRKPVIVTTPPLKVDVISVEPHALTGE